MPEDASVLMRKMYQNTEFMRLFRLNNYPENEEQLRIQIRKRLQISPRKSSYYDGLLVHDTHGIIGIAALADYVLLHRRAELQIGIFYEKHRLKGFGIEACLMLLDLGFNQFQLNRMYAYTYSYNTLAQRGLDSIGFELEGVQQQHVYDQSTNQFIDLHVYGLVVKKYRQSRRLAKLSQRLLGRDTTQIVPKRYQNDTLFGNELVHPSPNSEYSFRPSGPYFQ